MRAAGSVAKRKRSGKGTLSTHWRRGGQRAAILLQGREERRVVLLHQLIKKSRLGAVALVARWRLPCQSPVTAEYRVADVERFRAQRGGFAELRKRQLHGVALGGLSSLSERW